MCTFDAGVFFRELEVVGGACGNIMHAARVTHHSGNVEHRTLSVVHLTKRPVSDCVADSCFY